MGKIKELWEHFASFEGSLFRYSLAFSFLLALFPMLIIIVMLFHNSILDIELLLQYLYRFVPENLIGEYVNYLMEKNYPSTFTLVISLVAALNLASRSIYSFMLISAKNENYNLPKLVIRFKAYILFILLVVSVACIGVLAGFFNNPASITVAVGLFVVFFLLYRMLSFERKPLTYGIIGALFAMISIIITGQVFFKIVNYFTSYNSVYGPIASLVIALLSVYLISSLVYFGYCLNLVYSKSYAVQEYKHERLYEKLMAFEDAMKRYIRKIIPRKSK